MSNYVTELATAIRRALGEDSVPPGDADGLFRIYAVLALAKGKATTGEDVHNAWVAWVSTVDPHHESARPYRELDGATKRQDDPFVDAIHDVVASL